MRFLGPLLFAVATAAIALMIIALRNQLSDAWKEEEEVRRQLTSTEAALQSREAVIREWSQQNLVMIAAEVKQRKRAEAAERALAETLEQLAAARKEVAGAKRR